MGLISMVNWELAAHVAVTLIGGIMAVVVIPLFRLLMAMRDDVRDMKTKVADISGDFTKVQRLVDQHDRWITGIRYELGHTFGRTHRDVDPEPRTP